jgi:peptidoglycan/xylan/chitin deacetylase (PgdA/CDA1 family)
MNHIISCLKPSIAIIIIALIAHFYLLPSYLIKYLQRKYPLVLFNLRTHKAKLTIDDAPSPSTNAILDVLKKYNVTATFFVIGKNIQKYDPEGIILKRMIDEGHQIGNHMMRNKAALLMSNETLKREITDCQKIIESHVGDSYSNIFRPGCGFFNQNMINIVNSLGYQIMVGDVYPHDCQIRSSWHHYYFIMNKIKAGSIVILHDLLYNVKTLEMLLPKISHMF